MRISRYYFSIALMILGVQALSAQDTLHIDIGCLDGEPGQTICVPVTVENFQDMLSLQLPIIYDANVLSFNGVQSEALSGAILSQPGPNDVRYIWLDINVVGVSLPDGTTLFELCFDIVGVPGEITTIDMASTHAIDLEASDLDAEVFVDIEACDIEVQNTGQVGAQVTSCGSPDGIAEGSITVQAFGGTAPYTYDWTGPVSGSSNLANQGDSESQSLPIGSYTITITDAGGVSQMYSIDVVATGLISVSTGFDPTCYDFTNGRISIEATNGVEPYELVWRSITNSNIFGSGFIMGGVSQINSLPAGMYETIVSDANGCMVIDTVDLTSSPFDVQATINDATCTGAANGGISFSITGGNPDPGGYSLSFSWGGSIMADMFNTGPLLDPGTYFITISDAVAQCDSVYEFTVGALTTIGADIQVTDPTCPDATDGAALITGTPAAVYNFQRYDTLGSPIGAPQTGVAAANFVNLASGTYNVVVDNGACTSDTIPFTLTPPDSIQIDLVDLTAPGCVIGAADGEITVQASNGVIGPGSDYTYVWNGGLLTGSMITDLVPGNYTVVVTDDNGCTAEATYNLPQGDGPQIQEVIATNLSCTGDPVTTLEVVFTEGAAPVDLINWSDTDGNSVGTTTIITNQTGGDTLDILVADENMCFDIFNNYVVPGGNSLVIDSIRLMSPSCPGDNDGSITVFASGGVAPFSYWWSTGDTSGFNMLPGLTAGSYGVTVVDADTCGIADTTVLLEDITPFTFFFTGIDSTTCADICDGSATLVPSGGAPGLPFEFFWESGLIETGTQSTASALCGGWQTVTISQDNICFFTDSVFIPFPDPVGIELLEISDVSCAGAGDGRIVIRGTGGSGSYDYQWASLPLGAVQNNLEAGVYYATVRDDSGCTVLDSFFINEPDSLNLVIDSTTTMPVGCITGMEGAIGFQVIGGTAPFEYTWSPDVSEGPLAQQLTAGTYAVTITDESSCTDTITVELSGTPPLEVFFSEIIPPVCVGGNSEITIDSVTGGNGSYTYAIDGGPQLSIDTSVVLPVGFYSVVVSDESNCRDTTSVSVVAPPPIFVDILPEDAVVDLGDSLQLELIIDDTQGPVDSILWTANDQAGRLSCADCVNPVAFNLVPVTYFVTVTDSAGCVQTGDITVNVNNSRDVYVPNVFSPNRDGRNEHFMVFTGKGVQEITSVRVFDRWGELVQEVGPEPPDPNGVMVWDGTFNGNDMQPGVYVYIAEITFIDQPNNPIIVKGDVTLMR